MKTTVVLGRHVSAAVCALSALSVSGCGNGWFNSKERADTPAALMFDAQKAYDNEEYTKASELYEKVVQKDPSNVQARVGLSFSLNAEAGLSLVDLMGKIIKSEETSKNTSGTSSATSEVSKFTNVVGFSSSVEKEKTELDKIRTEMLTAPTATHLRSISYRFTKLHESWKAICPLIPAETLETLKANATVGGIFDLSLCHGGLPKGAKVSSSALFAAALGSLSQAAGLYQAVIDKEGDGKIDLVTQAEAVMADIKAAQTKVTQYSNTASAEATATCPQTGTAKSICLVGAMNDQVGVLNKGVNYLTTLRDQIDSQLIMMTMAHFKLLTSLVAQIPGIPEKVKTTINSTTSKLNDAETKLAGYRTAASSLGTTTTTGSTIPTGTATTVPTEVQAKAADAAKNADTMIAQQQQMINTVKATEPAKAAELQTQFDSNKTSVCTNFDALKTAYGLPTAQKPCDCETTSTAQYKCCAAKTTTADRDSCCVGVSGGVDANKTACMATTLPLALAESLSLAEPTAEVVDPASTPAHFDETTFEESLIEFWQLAESARKGAR